MKKIYITVRANAETKEKLKRICDETQRSQGQQIEYWIKNYKLKGGIKMSILNELKNKNYQEGLAIIEKWCKQNNAVISNEIGEENRNSMEYDSYIYVSYKDDDEGVYANEWFCFVQDIETITDSEDDDNITLSDEGKWQFNSDKLGVSYTD
jgi:hypothetical protein